MAQDDTKKSSTAAGRQRRSISRASTLDTGTDVAALDAVLGLGVRVARARIETCATLLGNAEAAIVSQQEVLAINAILDAEPLLYEAQTILNATTMLRRIVRESQLAKT